MNGPTLDTADRLALAQAGVTEAPDGSLRSASGAIVSPGVAVTLIARKDRLGGEQAFPATTAVSPDPRGGPGDRLAKVIPAASQFRRGPLTAGHEAPSPGDEGNSNPVIPVTGSGREVYESAAAAYGENEQKARLHHVEPSQCITSTPVAARWAPPADLGAANVPQPRAAGATQRAPGE